MTTIGELNDFGVAVITLVTGGTIVTSGLTSGGVPAARYATAGH